MKDLNYLPTISTDEPYGPYWLYTNELFKISGADFLTHPPFLRETPAVLIIQDMGKYADTATRIEAKVGLTEEQMSDVVVAARMP